MWMWMASGVSRRNCDVWWSWSGGDVCAGGDVGGDRVWVVGLASALVMVAATAVRFVGGWCRRRGQG